MKKITTNTKSLLSAVATANSYTSKDGDFARSITLIGNDGKIEVKATDMIQTIILKNIDFVSSDLTNPNFEAISLDGKKLGTVLKAAKGEDVVIELNNGFITVKSGRSRAKIETMAKNQEIHIEKGYGKSIKLESCIDGMNKLAHAIDQNNPKYELNGLLIKTKNGKIEMVATDTRRLAVVSGNIAGDDDIEIIIPKQTVSTITKLFSSVDIEAEADGTSFSIYSPFVEYTTKQISGMYPDFKRILPKEFSQTVVLKTTSLAEVVSEAAMFESDVIMSIRDQTITVMDINGNTETSLPQDESIYIHTDIHFAVNSKYILDVLTAINTETVELCFNSSNIPFVLKSENLEEVIMPVQMPEEDEANIKEAA